MTGTDKTDHSGRSGALNELADRIAIIANEYRRAKRNGRSAAMSDVVGNFEGIICELRAIAKADGRQS